MIHARNKIFVSVVALMIGGGLAACGGSSKSSSTTTSTTTSKASSASAVKPAATSHIHATLHGENHAPIAGKLWAYSVHVTEASGHPLSGTVRIQFTLGGLVVGTDNPPVHPVKNGSWHDTLTFPKAAVGHPLTFQAIVHTTAGSATLNWPVTVKP